MDANKGGSLGMVALAVLETVVRKQSVCMITGPDPRTYSRKVRGYESQVKCGYLSVHRSSIGEPNEKATYTLTEAGLRALENDRDGI